MLEFPLLKTGRLIVGQCEVGKSLIYWCTVEPLNNGHFGDDHFPIVQRLSLLRR